MEFLDVDWARIAYRVRGAGPPLVAPECNYTWTDAVEARLAERFTLIVPSPRDYGRSTRTGGPEYDVGRWATDVQAVARHAGYERFLYFGYSFTGAFGPWLARRLRDSDAVAAVAAGGFPATTTRGSTPPSRPRCRPRPTGCCAGPTRSACAHSQRRTRRV